MTLMLTASHQNFAVAASGGGLAVPTGSGAAALAGANGGGAGGMSAEFSSARGTGAASNSLGTDIPPECARISDPVERQICIEEYAKGAPPPPDADALRRRARQEAMLRH